MSIVLARYNGPAVLRWDAGETPVSATLTLRQDMLEGGTVAGMIGWDGSLHVPDVAAAWDAWQGQNREQLTLAIGERSALLTVTNLTGAKLLVTGSDAPPFGDVVD